MKDILEENTNVEKEKIELNILHTFPLILQRSATERLPYPYNRVTFPVFSKYVLEFDAINLTFPWRQPSEGTADLDT